MRRLLLRDEIFKKMCYNYKKVCKISLSTESYKSSRRIMLGATGGVISVFIIVMAIYMIVQSNKKLRQLKTAEESSNG